MTAPKPLKFESELLKVEQLSDNTKHFEFKVVDEFVFTPGQFVMVGLPGDDGKPIRRAFSIASKPSQKGFIDLCIKILPDGRLSSRLDKLDVGARVTMEGPYGKFVLQDEHQDELFFLAAGTGIAPLRSMIHDLLEQGCTKKMTVLFGFRNATDFLYKEELEHCASQHENFKVIAVRSKPDDQWDGLKGYVQDHLEEHISNPTQTDVYMCGPPKMVAETVSKLLKLDVKRIFREAWG